METALLESMLQLCLLHRIERLPVTTQFNLFHVEVQLPVARPIFLQDMQILPVLQVRDLDETFNSWLTLTLTTLLL